MNVSILFILQGSQKLIIYKYKNRMSDQFTLHRSSSSLLKRSYHKVTKEEKQALIQQVIENKRSINKAAKIVGLNISTAKVLIRRHKSKSAKLSKLRKNSYENQTSLVQRVCPQNTDFPIYSSFSPVVTYQQPMTNMWQPFQFCFYGVLFQ